MKSSRDHGITSYFQAHHYALFVAALILSFFGSYVISSFTQVIAPQQPTPAVSTPAKGVPALKSSVVIGSLDHPWDVAFLPDETMLVTERSGGVSAVRDGKKAALFTPQDVTAKGEGGMLGLAVDPEFDQNHLIYTCFNSNKSDIRVVSWKIKPDGSGLVSRGNDIVTGIPANPSGRHSGCRLGFGADDKLWIGTGDAANENNPQNMRSLGGKILHVDRSGAAVPGNNTVAGADQRIYSWGHRNTQGIAFYDEAVNGSYGVSVEHGSDRDDEVNPLKKGNFGWAPGSGYDESVAMTDLTRFPAAVKSIWSSGNPTIATSGVAILKGNQWKSWEGRLAIGVLKDKHVLLLEIKSNGTIGEQRKLLDNEFGRLRAVVMGPDGALYVTTDNGSDDKIIKLIAS